MLGPEGQGWHEGRLSEQEVSQEASQRTPNALAACAALAACRAGASVPLRLPMHASVRASQVPRLSHAGWTVTILAEPRPAPACRLPSWQACAVGAAPVPPPPASSPHAWPRLATQPHTAAGRCGGSGNIPLHLHMHTTSACHLACTPPPPPSPTTHTHTPSPPPPPPHTHPPPHPHTPTHHPTTPPPPPSPRLPAPPCLPLQSTGRKAPLTPTLPPALGRISTGSRQAAQVGRSVGGCAREASRCAAPSCSAALFGASLPGIRLTSRATAPCWPPPAVAPGKPKCWWCPCTSASCSCPSRCSLLTCHRLRPKAPMQATGCFRITTLGGGAAAPPPAHPLAIPTSGLTS